MPSKPEHELNEKSDENDGGASMFLKRVKPPKGAGKRKSEQNGHYETGGEEATGQREIRNSTATGERRSLGEPDESLTKSRLTRT